MALAWLGLTAGCAVCHDHKYDPLTTKEFYSLYAFFNSAADPAMDGNINVTAPFLKLPPPKQKAATEAAAKVERDARDWIDAVVANVEYRDPAVFRSPNERKPVREVLIDDVLPIGSTARSTSRNAIDWVTDPPFKAVSGRRVIRQAFGSSYNDDIEFKLRPIVIPEEAIFEFSVRVEATEIPASIGFGLVNGKTVTWTRTDAGLVREPAKQLEIMPGQWNKLTVSAADLGLKAGDRLNGLRLGETGGIACWDAITLTGQADRSTDPLESLTAWRKALGTSVPPELPGDLNSLIQAGPGKELSVEDATRLRRYYLSVIARPVNDDLASDRSALEAARTARIVADETAPGTFIFKDTDKPRESFVMMRGQYDNKGEPVVPRFPPFCLRLQGRTSTHV